MSLVAAMKFLQTSLLLTTTLSFALISCGNDSDFDPSAGDAGAQADGSSGDGSTADGSTADGSTAGPDASTAALTLSLDIEDLAVGGEATLTVRAEPAPTGDLTVRLNGTGSGAVTFGEPGTAQAELTLNGAEATIRVTGSAIGPVSITADADGYSRGTAGLQVTGQVIAFDPATELSLGAGRRETVRVTATETGTVTVTVSDQMMIEQNGDAAGEDGLTLVFPEGGGEQSFTVIGKDEPAIESGDASITITSAGLTETRPVAYTAMAAIVVYDSETGGNLVENNGTLNLTEGGEVTVLWVALTAPAHDTIDVILSPSGDPVATVVLYPSNCSFTVDDYATHRCQLRITPKNNEDDAVDGELRLGVRSQIRGWDQTIKVTDTTPAFVVAPTSIDVFQDGSATFTVTPRVPLTSDQTVTIGALSDSQSDALTVSDSSLSFTNGQGPNDGQTVTVNGGASLTAATPTIQVTTGADGALVNGAAGDTGATVTVIVEPDQDIVVTAVDGTDLSEDIAIDEGASLVYEVRLRRAPASAVNLILSADAGLSIENENGGTLTTLTFSANDSAAKRVVVRAEVDAGTISELGLTVTVSDADGALASQMLTFNVTDTTQALIYSLYGIASLPLTGAQNIDEGEQGMYYVVLRHPAGADGYSVTLTPTDSIGLGENGTLRTQTLTFASGVSSRAIYVTGIVDDSTTPPTNQSLTASGDGAADATLDFNIENTTVQVTVYDSGSATVGYNTSDSRLALDEADTATDVFVGLNIAASSDAPAYVKLSCANNAECGLFRDSSGNPVNEITLALDGWSTGATGDRPAVRLAAPADADDEDEAYIVTAELVTGTGADAEARDNSISSSFGVDVTDTQLRSIRVPRSWRLRSVKAAIPAS